MGYLLIITLVFITDLIVKTVIEKTYSQGKQKQDSNGAGNTVTECGVLAENKTCKGTDQERAQKQDS